MSCARIFSSCCRFASVCARSRSRSRRATSAAVSSGTCAIVTPRLLTVSWLHSQHVSGDRGGGTAKGLRYVTVGA